MGIKVHGTPSGATLRVLVTLEEMAIDFELIPIDMSSDAHKQQPFLSLSPFGQVPAFEDGDLKLFESRAITKYIAHTYEGKGTSLINKDKDQMTNISLWMEVEAHQFDPISFKLIHEIIVNKIKGKETDNAIVEENVAKFAKVLDVYEARLAMSKFLAGDSYTLADLHHLPALQYLMETKVKYLFDERPHVLAWCKDILARPASQKIWASQKLV